MKANYYISIAMAVVMGIGISGCSLLDRSQKHVVQGSDGNVREERTAVTSDVANGPVLTPPKNGNVSKAATSTQSGGKAVKNKNKKKKDKLKNSGGVSKSELAEARREVAQGGQNEAVMNGGEKGNKSSAESSTNLPGGFSINGEWTVYSVRDNIVTGEERPYMTFDLQAGRFYGSNGCNIINGDLVTDDKNDLRLENMIATMRMCQDAPFEYLINLAVSDVRSFSARQEGPVTFLDLKGADGRIVLVLRRHNMDFLNGAWKVESLNGKPLTGTDDATMTINIPDLKIHGTTGCNIFNGSLFIDPDKIDSMQFMDIATTRMMCPPDSRETEFLLGLESVETAKALGNGFIGMYDTQGKEVFTMQRIELRDAEGME